MSLMSKTFGYRELCGLSHEFLRRGMSFTPTEISWAGDFVIASDPILKQSEIFDIRGENNEVQTTYDSDTSDCSSTTVGIPTEYKVEETSIRERGNTSFKFLVEKAENVDDEKNWDIGVYESTDECGVLMDGGDALYRPSVKNTVSSLCGTVIRDGGALPISAYYLDNRNSNSDDPDNGLLVAIQSGPGTLEVRYCKKELLLNTGLSESIDITLEFRKALNDLGMSDADVLQFGMI